MSENPKLNLNRETASELLNNVLDNCDIPASTKSLDEMMLRSALARKPLRFAKFIAVIFVIIAVLSPLAFKSDPDFVLINSAKSVAVSSHILYDDCFILTLTGDADFTNINAKKNNGAIIYPDQIDESTGLVVFPYNGEELNIYIPSRSGGCIQAVLYEKK